MIYEVRNVEYDDYYWKKIEAIDEEHAAELWARWQDSHSAEYAIVGGRSEPTVEVRGKDGNLTRWTLTGETVAQYRARKSATSTTTTSTKGTT